MIYASSLDGLWYVLGLVAIFGVIVLAVILIKKYWKPFKNEEKPKSDKEIADEEVKRMVVDVDDETAQQMDEASKELVEKSKEDKPEEKEVVAEEVDRATRPVENEETAKAMVSVSKKAIETKDEKQDSKATKA